MKADDRTNVPSRIPSVSDRTLMRLIRWGLMALVVGVALVFGVHFLFNRGVDPGPTLVERQIEAAKDAVKKAPDEIEPRLVLAQVYSAASQPDKALEQYDEVLKVKPRQKTALLGRGDILLANGDLGGAARAYEKVVDTAKGGEFARVDRQLEHAYYGLGTIALAQNRAKDAVTAAEAAVEIDATDADAWYLLGTSAIKAGAPARAAEALRRAVLFVPTGWCEPYAALSQAYAKLGRPADAEYAGAMVDFCQQRPGQAAQRLQALTSGPAAVDAMLGLGMIAEGQADRAGAISWYQKVLAADPESFNALAGLSRLGAAPPAEAPGSTTPAGDTPSEGGVT